MYFSFVYTGEQQNANCKEQLPMDRMTRQKCKAAWPSWLNPIYPSMWKSGKNTSLCPKNTSFINVSTELEMMSDAWQKCGNSSDAITTSFGPIRRLNFLSITGYAHLHCLT